MPSGTLSTFDLILIFAYFVILIVLGYLSSRKQKEEDYLIADRKLGTWSTMATMNASKSGSILMSFVALVYLWGFSAVWYFVGAVVGVALFIPFALRLRRNSKERFYTLADYFRYNYGKRPAIFASLVSIFLMFGLGVINLIAGTKIFVFFTGWPFWICAILMSFIILIYLLLGGFRAVAKTDVVQYIAMILILFLLVIALFDGSLIPASEWDFFKADIGTIVGFFIVGVLYPFASADLWQRVYSSRGRKQLKNGMVLSVLFYALMGLLLSLVALTVKVQFPDVDPDLALLNGFGSLLPPGLLGLASVLLFSAIMSTLDTNVFTGSSAIIQDFFDWKKKKAVKNLKKMILLFLVVLTLIGVLIQSLVISTYIVVAFYLVLAIPIMATWVRRKIKAITLVVGFLTGIFSVIFMLIYYGLVGDGIQPSLAIIAIILTIVGLIVGGIISFFKK